MGRDVIFNQQLLPCGKTMSNRLVKVAMYEHFASIFGGTPNDYHYALYSAWSEHDWGMIITGNVIASPDHLTLGRDLVVPQILTDSALAPFERLAKVIHGQSSETLAVMQLNHAGRQSSNILGGRAPFASPLGPSSLRFGLSKQKKQGVFSDLFHRLLFQTPKAMSSSDIETMISDFIRGASLALQSGFDGVQLHVAHGYLLAQFLSEKANIRTDEYAASSLLLLSRVVKGIREVVPPDFIVGIKFNTSDYSIFDNGEARKAQEDRAFAHLRQVISWKAVDFIEISGGDYESPEFMLSSTAYKKSPRQAFFAEFSSKLVAELSSTTASDALPLILLTGGLRNPAQLHTAVSAGHTHLLGIGRLSVLSPDLPTVLKDRMLHQDTSELEIDLTPFKPEPDLSLSFTKRWPWRWLWHHVPKVTLIGAGVGMAWYVVMMRRIARERMNRARRTGQKMSAATGVSPDYSIGGLGAVIRMWIWIDAPLPKAGSLVIFAVLVLLISLVSH